jgi:uncharacterized protein YcbK (DUF882 family)
VKTKQLTKNFNISEFRCKDGSDVPEELENNCLELANNLQVIRDKFCIELGYDMPIDVESGYRTWKHHLNVYKKSKKKAPKNSFHLTAQAADITVKKGDKELLQHLYILIQELIDTDVIKKGGIQIYWNQNTPFIHYDTRGVKAHWKT